MLRGTRTIEFTEDDLFTAFKAALMPPNGAWHPLVGRSYEGVIPNYPGTDGSFSSDSPDDWQKAWTDVGVPVPPVDLPGGHMFHLLITTDTNFFVRFRLGEAVMQASGVALSFERWRMPLPREAQGTNMAAYHFIILPNTNVTVTSQDATLIEGTASRVYEGAAPKEGPAISPPGAHPRPGG